MKKLQHNGYELTFCNKKETERLGIEYFVDLGDNIFLYDQRFTIQDIIKLLHPEKESKVDYSTPQDWFDSMAAWPDVRSMTVWYYPEGSLFGEPLNLSGWKRQVKNLLIDSVLERKED